MLLALVALNPVPVIVIAVPGIPSAALVDVISGGAVTVIVLVDSSVQPAAFVPVIVYVVVLYGVAVTDEPVVADNPVAGAHV